jgi:ubiquinone/menaquinone biosynthesis C-methylase UbiE
MDEPDIDPRTLRRSLRFIRRVNSLLGYTRATLWHLKRFSRHWRGEVPITILDVATGSADIPVAILRWAARRGFDVRVVGLDRHAATASIASERAGREAPALDGARLTIVRGDALSLPFDDRSFDYVLTNMFLHHLPEERSLIAALREMDRVARRGIVVADLLRHRRAYLWITLFTQFAHPIVRHDARLSVAQAFTKPEIFALRDRAAINYATYRRHFGHRFVLAGSKPDAP